MKKDKTKKNGRAKYFLRLAILCFAFSLPLSSLAEGPAPLSRTDAFKWYEFNNLDLSVSSATPNAMAGDFLPLAFDIINKNKYPITEGSLYIKIYREADTDFNKDYFKEVPTKEEMNKSLSLVDQFFAFENISIDTGGKIRLEYDYKIPKATRGGKYKVYAYFQSIKKINLQGLSFTDDVPGGIFLFKVSNPDQSGTVEFDRGNVLVNGELYNFSSAVKIYGADEEVNISVPLENSTLSAQKISISRTYSSWDGLLEKNVFGSEKSSLALEPGKSGQVEFVVPRTANPVTYVTIKAEWGDNAQSIANIRFARNVPVGARINSAGVSNFPIKANEPVNVFLTTHEIGPGGNAIIMGLLDEEGVDADKSVDFEKNKPTYRIEATLKDNNQKILKSFIYEGKLSEEVFGFEGKFDPRDNYNYLVLEATLTNLSANKAMDTTTLTYYCQNKNFSGCTENADFAQKGSIKEQKNERSASNRNIVIVVVVVFLLILGIVYKLGIRKMLAIIFLFAALSFLGVFSQVSSASVASAAPEDKFSPPVIGLTPPVVHKSELGAQSSGYKFFWMRLTSYNWRIDYSAQSSIPSGALGAPLNLGDHFTITDTTHLNSEAIFWNATGRYADTPYGYWSAGASLDTSRYDNVYDASYLFGTHTLDASLAFNTFDPAAARASKMDVGVDNLIDGYSESFFSACSATSAGALTKTVSGSGPPIVCSKITDYSWDCEVVSLPASGQASVKMVYGCTHGAFYYRGYQSGADNSTPGSCTVRGEQCHYYDGIFQKKLITSFDEPLGNTGGGTQEYLAPGSPGVCNNVAAAGSPYTYPPQAPDDGCRCPSSWCEGIGKTACTRTGPRQCANGEGDLRPIVPTQEIVFTYNFASPDFTASLVADPSSYKVGSTNPVDLDVTLLPIVAGSAPVPYNLGDTASFTLDCGDGNGSFLRSGIGVLGTILGSYVFSFPDACDYASAGNYSATVSVTLSSVTRTDDAGVVVTSGVPPSLSCGTANGKEYCEKSEINLADRCPSGIIAGDIDFNYMFQSFQWTCEDSSGNEVSCSADQKCPSSGLWKEIAPEE